MIQDIRYKGLSVDPSDYACGDGWLEAALGLSAGGGTLSATGYASRRALPGVGNVARAYLHKNGYSHLVVVGDGGPDGSVGPQRLLWCDWRSGAGVSGSVSVMLELEAGERVTELCSVGNILVTSTDRHLRYHLWKDGVYRYLGTELPRPEIQFALTGEVWAKGYANTGLTFRNSTENTAGCWKIIRQSHPEANADRIYFSTAVSLTAGSLYAAAGDGNIGVGYNFRCVFEGQRSDNGQWEEFLAIRTGGSGLSNPHVFRPERDYSNVRYHFGGAEKTTVYLLEAVDGTPVGSVVERTAENYTRLLALMNDYTAQCATEKNRFVYPFFVRYAVRLYDGSHGYVSPPALLVPNSGYVPMVTYGQDIMTVDNLYAYAFVADLQYCVLHNELLTDDWSDLIEGVDIYVSSPAYPYAQDKGFDTTREDMYRYLCVRNGGSDDKDELTGVSAGMLSLHYSGEGAGVDAGYRRHDLYGVLHGKYGFAPGDGRTYNVVQLDARDDVRKQLADTCAYYLYESVGYGDLRSGMTGAGRSEGVLTEDDFVTLRPDGRVLATLAEREALSDEPMGGRTLVSGYVYGYNNRLHVYGGRVRLADPLGVDLANGYLTTDGTVSERRRVTDTYVWLHTDSGDKVVCHSHGYGLSSRECCLFQAGRAWYYYPDPRAYRLSVRVETEAPRGVYSYSLYSLPLTRHDFISGAYWLGDDVGGGRSIGDVASVGTDEVVVDDTVDAGQMVYVSEADNPLCFLSRAAVRIGACRVVRLASAAKALSSGQFGEFPLYALTDSGVWALSVTADGSYRSVQPLTRDVVLSHDGVCQTDGSVLFATERGVMMLTGSQSVCVTEGVMERGGSRHDVMSLPGMETLLSVLNGTAGDGYAHLPVTGASLRPLSMLDFLSRCRMVYHYTGQRVVVFAPGDGFGYVYSLRDKAWTQVQTGYTSVVNAYPEAVVVDGGSGVADLDSRVDGVRVRSVVVTRPLKLGGADTHKTVRRVYLRGVYDWRNVLVTVVWGSDDLRRWDVVWSSRGDRVEGVSSYPYKYFRVGFVATLSDGDCVDGCSVEFLPRVNGRMR